MLNSGMPSVAELHFVRDLFFTCCCLQADNLAFNATRHPRAYGMCVEFTQAPFSAQLESDVAEANCQQF